MSIQIGDVLLFSEGRDGKMVSFDTTGKVILCKNKVKEGYVKVQSVDERDKVILITGKNVIYDYYEGIKPDEFMKMITRFGYKVGFKRAFVGNWGNEYQIFAYNLKNSSVIVADTIHNADHFNSIEIYCPGVNGLRQSGYFTGLIVCGDSIAVVDLCHRCGRVAKNSMHLVMDMINSYPLHSWIESDTFNLWTYADTNLETDSTGHFALYENTIDRYLLAPEEADVLFKNIRRMQPTLAKRKRKPLTVDEFLGLSEGAKIKIEWVEDGNAYLGTLNALNMIILEDTKTNTKYIIAEHINRERCRVYLL